MRRKDRQMDEEFAYSIIDKAKFGTLATVNEDGSPYCIPVSIVRSDNKIYIHSAMKGQKIDNIKRNQKVCLSFVGDVKDITPDDEEETKNLLENPELLKKIASSKFTTGYESAVVYGEANIVSDREEKILALGLLSEKYNPYHMAYFDAAIEGALKITNVIRIDIDNITGKAKRV